MNSDKQAIRALKGNNNCEIEAAFNYIYDKYCKLIFLCILTMVKDKRDAEELTNDVFIKVFNNRHRLCEEKNIKYYLVTIAKNISIDFLKRKRVIIILNEEYVFNCVENSTNDELSSIKEELKLYLNELDTEIIIEHIIFELKFVEIAQHHHLPLNSVKTKYFRAINKIRKEMRDDFAKSEDTIWGAKNH